MWHWMNLSQTCTFFSHFAFIILIMLMVVFIVCADEFCAKYEGSFAVCAKVTA